MATMLSVAPSLASIPRADPCGVERRDMVRNGERLDTTL
jgi:hypothetical protein